MRRPATTAAQKVIAKLLGNSRKITANDFHQSTLAVFTAVDAAPKRKPDYVSGTSRYWIGKTGVYRQSDHWGAGIKTVAWFLDTLPYTDKTLFFDSSKMHDATGSFTATGYALFSSFVDKPNGAAGMKRQDLVTALYAAGVIKQPATSRAHSALRRVVARLTSYGS